MMLTETTPTPSCRASAAFINSRFPFDQGRLQPVKLTRAVALRVIVVTTARRDVAADEIFSKSLAVITGPGPADSPVMTLIDSGCVSTSGSGSGSGSGNELFE